MLALSIRRCMSDWALRSAGSNGGSLVDRESGQPLQCASFFGRLAQLVEQRTFNPLVRGSSPRPPTRIPAVEQSLAGSYRKAFSLRDGVAGAAVFIPESPARKLL